MLVLLALLATAPAAATDAPANANAPVNGNATGNAKPADAHLKVLVLDVASTDMTASEKTTLTNLEAAHLSEDARLDVLSGEDLRELVKLQGQAADLGVSGNCTDACMAELAGALGAGVVIATQAGKLGETLVVTLAVFDASKAKSVSRKSIQATSLGELPAKMGPALDALVTPLLPGGLHHDPVVTVASAQAAPPVTSTTTSPTPAATPAPPPPPTSSQPAQAENAGQKAASDQAQASHEDDTLLWVLLGVGTVAAIVVVVALLASQGSGSSGSGL